MSTSASTTRTGCFPGPGASLTGTPVAALGPAVHVPQGPQARRTAHHAWPARSRKRPRSHQRGEARSPRRVNETVIDFADPGSISTGFLAKIPGPELALGHATMRFNYKDSFAMANALEGYERLILLAMMGASRCSPGRTGSSGCGRSPRPFWTTRRRSSRTPAARGGRSRSASSSRRTAGTCPSVSAAVMRGLSWRMDRPPPAPSETPSSSSVSRSRPS